MLINCHSRSSSWCAQSDRGRPNYKRVERLEHLIAHTYIYIYVKKRLNNIVHPCCQFPRKPKSLHSRNSWLLGHKRMTKVARKLWWQVNVVIFLQDRDGSHFRISYRYRGYCSAKRVRQRWRCVLHTSQPMTFNKVDGRARPSLMFEYMWINIYWLFSGFKLQFRFVPYQKKHEEGHISERKLTRGWRWRGRGVSRLQLTFRQLLKAPINHPEST
jgi:hypothetical protein